MAARKQAPTKPPYFETLDSPSKARYVEKLTVIDKLDPYSLSNDRYSADPGILPSITYPDIVNYLVYSPSPYSLDDLRCFKGLEAYNQFVNGWVRDVKATIINDRHLVSGRVLHSQQLRETPLKPWLVAEKTGKIVCAHCNCMAGLGETCTHVCALLFHIETKVRIRDSKTVTQEAAYWKLPTCSREVVTYLPVSEIDFTSARSMKKRLDMLVSENITLTPGKRQVKHVPSPTDDEMSSLFLKLNLAGSKAAALRVVPEHCKSFKPTSLANKFPHVLTNMYEHDNVKLSFSDLLKICEEVEVKVTPEQAKSVEKATKEQSNTKLWYRFRSGRVTASKMKRICKSNPDQPSQSLVKSVCYPESTSFTVASTQWGCKHEGIAKKVYSEKMLASHDNFEIKSSGFVINTEFPHIGATPDALVTCDCCGSGVLEIKCPYCARNSTVAEYATETRTCLSSKDGHLFLKKEHDYMYQIQTQIHVCGVEYADFVVWTEKDIHIERLEGDIDMWRNMLAASEQFFRKAVLPELLGKFYSRSETLGEVEINMPSTSGSSKCDDNQQEPVYCYCGGPEDLDDMVACDDENCKLQWFHMGCLQMTSVPRGKWFCPECRKKKVKSVNKRPKRKQFSDHGDN